MCYQEFTWKEDYQDKIIYDRFNASKSHQILPDTPKGIIKFSNMKQNKIDVGNKESYSLLPSESSKLLVKGKY